MARSKKPIAIAGAGLSGAVVARQLAEAGYRVNVFESRNHVGGNCHTYLDPETGILVHAHGPHGFHTSNERVWRYVNRFGRFKPFELRVKAVTESGLFSLPINLLTINQFFKKQFSPAEAQTFIRSRANFKGVPTNFEEQALASVGEELYKAFFKGYTEKQWGVPATEISPSVFKRLPIRYNYEDDYHEDKYQGVPEDGYTALIEEVLDHESISLLLSSPFRPEDIDHFDTVFYTGPIDSFFSHRFGRLGYRSLRFENFRSKGDYQGTAVMNFCAKEVPYTRITEHKFFAPYKKHNETITSVEYPYAPMPGDTLYYPMRLSEDKKRLEKYQQLALGLPSVIFLGRLGRYQYINMDVAVSQALETADSFLLRKHGLKTGNQLEPFELGNETGHKISDLPT